MGNYQFRVVAFVDVLGWEQATLDSQHSNDVRDVLFSATENITDIFGDTGFPHIARSVFSDSIAFSTKFPMNGDPWEYFEFWRYVFHAYRICLENGFLLRGGVACNLLHHSGSTIFGPALTEAIRLEKQASMPRTLVSENAFRIMSEVTGQYEYEIRSFVKRSGDGFLYFDYLRFWHPARAGDDAKLWCEQIYPKVSEMYAHGILNENKSIVEKHQWFARYYNEVASEFGIREIVLR